MVRKLSLKESNSGNGYLVDVFQDPSIGIMSGYSFTDKSVKYEHLGDIVDAKVSGRINSIWVLPVHNEFQVQINCSLGVTYVGISGKELTTTYKHASIVMNNLKTDKLLTLTHDALLTDIFDYLEY